jgi:hypothetical protein
MNQDKLEALLGRPLTSCEVTNRKLYLQIAQERLEDLTCLNLEEATEDRTYSVREGYQTVFTDMFTTVNSVTVNGSELDAADYTAMQWNKRTADWYNSVVLKNCTPEDTIVINADWGACSPTLQLLQAKLFGLVSSMNNSNGNVSSKKVEDFSISFNDNTVYEQFLLDNQALIGKYSICNIQTTVSGDVYPQYFDTDLGMYVDGYRGRPY